MKKRWFSVLCLVRKTQLDLLMRRPSIGQSSMTPPRNPPTQIKATHGLQNMMTRQQHNTTDRLVSAPKCFHQRGQHWQAGLKCQASVCVCVCEGLQLVRDSVAVVTGETWSHYKSSGKLQFPSSFALCSVAPTDAVTDVSVTHNETNQPIRAQRNNNM